MRSFIKIISALALSLIIVCASFAATRRMTAGQPEQTVQPAQETQAPKQTGKMNILILGVDKDQTRADTIMAVSCNLDENYIRILSVPRDTRVYFGGDHHKINAAYGRGVQQIKETVTALTGIPFDRYMVFTTDAFRDVIDALGGVWFDVPRDMNYRDPKQNLTISLKKGYQLLDGDKAEQLVRFRRYPEGDIARIHMQQKFFAALAEQKLNKSIITNLPRLYGALSKNITTDISISDIMKYLPNMSDLSAENVSIHDLPGNYNDTDYGASYWICDKMKTKELVRAEFGY